jgi:hypothetical protein
MNLIAPGPARLDASVGRFTADPLAEHRGGLTVDVLSFCSEPVPLELPAPSPPAGIQAIEAAVWPPNLRLRFPLFDGEKEFPWSRSRGAAIRLDTD